MTKTTDIGNGDHHDDHGTSANKQKVKNSGLTRKYNHLLIFQTSQTFWNRKNYPRKNS